ncbi:MAG: TIGR02186 family protein [Rhodobacteraceae bacterium]|nr:TIGR02186 family protein [Paracoccaceae bacterium]
MRWCLAICLALWSAVAPAQAEDIVLGLSQDEVAITASFDGSEILIFGAIKRDGPIPDGPPVEVIVTVAGPLKPIVVRRKEKRFGIWVNTDAVEIDAAPSFYAVATSAPLTDVLKDVEDLRHHISIPRAIRSVGAPMSISDAPSFTDALIRIRETQSQFQLLENQVAVDEQTLFRTRVTLPAALTEGDYPTRIYLTREGEVISSYETVIDVKKVGLERWLYTMSRENALLYGLMSLAIAIAAGWGASAAFSIFRP